MKLSEHSDVKRSLILLGVPIEELVAIEDMHGAEAAAALEKFKERITSAFRTSVRTEHHPDHGSDPADIARRADNFRTIRSFLEWVKQWRIKPEQIRPVFSATIDLTDVLSFMQSFVDDFNEEIRRQSFVINLQDFEPPIRKAESEPPRRRSTFRSSPRGTEVESQSTRDGGRIHRVRIYRKG